MLVFKHTMIRILFKKRKSFHSYILVFLSSLLFSYFILYFFLFLLFYLSSYAVTTMAYQYIPCNKLLINKLLVLHIIYLGLYLQDYPRIIIYQYQVD